MAGQPILIACSHSLEGILAAVGASYLARLRPEGVRICAYETCQPRLGEAVFAMPSVSDEQTGLATRVFQGLEKSVSAGCALARGGACPGGCDAACVRRIAYAVANDAPEAPEAVHRYVRLAFEMGPRIRTMQTDPTVVELTRLASFALGECEHMRQFVRFKHMSDGSLFASFSCAANTLPFVAPHFVARNMEDRFCIVDPAHRIAAFHEAKARHATCVLLDEELTAQLAGRDDYAADEAYVEAMWQALYRGLTLEGRGAAERGYDLQAHWIPKRLRKGLVEMEPSVERGLLYVPERYAG